MTQGSKQVQGLASSTLGVDNEAQAQFGMKKLTRFSPKAHVALVIVHAGVAPY